MKILIKKIALSNSPVPEWYKSGNTGDFPGKFTLKKLPMGVVVYIDSKIVGLLGTEVNGTFAPYNGNDISFDEKGICVSIVDVVVNGIKNDILSGEVKITAVQSKKEVPTNVSYEDEVTRIVSNGIQTRERVEDNIRIMERNKVKPNTIRLVLQQYEKWDDPVHIARVPYVPVNDEGYMEDILEQILDKGSMILEGGMSVGKNVMAETIAQVMNWPYGAATYGEDASYDDVYGGKSTDNSASENLKSKNADFIKKVLEYNRTGNNADEAAEYEILKTLATSVRITNDFAELTHRLEKGGIFGLHEMNYARANLLGSFLNQILDGTGFLTIPGKGRVNIHPKFAIIATQNPDYSGTQEYNQATRHRFGVLNFGYPKSIIGPLKANMQKLGLEVEESVYKVIDKFYSECLRAYIEGTNGMVLSDESLNIRGYVKALQKVAKYGADLKHQIMVQVINGCPKKEIKILEDKLNLQFE